jgi:hypothetical protein
MVAAQFETWCNGTYGKAAIACCKEFKPKSALCVAAIFGAANHWPGVM